LAGAGTAVLGGAAYEAHRNQADTQTGTAPNTTGPQHSRAANVVDPTVLSEPQKQKNTHTESTAKKSTSTTEGKPSIVEKVKQKIMPGSYLPEPSEVESQPSYSGESEEHHSGRDAAIAGGAATAGVGAYEASKKHDDNTSGNVVSGERGVIGSSSNPYSSSSLDPRVDSPDHHRSTELSHGLTGSAVDSTPSKDQHSFGRDAAVGGGVGLAGLGAYEAKKHHDQGESVPQAAASGPAAPTTSTSTHTTTSTSTTGHPTSSSTQPFTTSVQPQSDSHNTGHNTALAGAAGVGAYETSKHLGQHDTTHPASSSVNEQALSGYQDQRAVAHHPAHQTGNEVQPTQEPHQHHIGRDAAAIGAVGASGAAAHHELSKKDAEKLEKEKLKEHEKLEKARHKEEEKHEKHAAKSHEKEEKEHKPSLISRILHHGKDKHKEEDVATDSKHHKEEAALGAGAAGAGVAAHERNKLHKDPPRGYHSNLNDDGQHMGTDGQIGDAHNVSGLQ
jgi:hypothetical protein